MVCYTKFANMLLWSALQTTFLASSERVNDDKNIKKVLRKFSNPIPGPGGIEICTCKFNKFNILQE